MLYHIVVYHIVMYYDMSLYMYVYIHTYIQFMKTICTTFTRVRASRWLSFHAHSFGHPRAARDSLTCLPMSMQNHCGCNVSVTLLQNHCGYDASVTLLQNQCAESPWLQRAFFGSVESPRDSIANDKLARFATFRL